MTRTLTQRQVGLARPAGRGHLVTVMVGGWTSLWDLGGLLWCSPLRCHSDWIQWEIQQCRGEGNLCMPAHALTLTMRFLRWWQSYG